MNRLALPVGTTGLYNTHPFVATSLTKNDDDVNYFQQLFAFSDGYGWLASGEDDDNLSQLPKDKTYRWVTAPKSNDLVEANIRTDGYNCVVCHGFNKYAESNLTEDRHICFSCRASYSWKYEDEFLVKGL